MKNYSYLSDYKFQLTLYITTRIFWSIKDCHFNSESHWNRLYTQNSSSFSFILKPFSILFYFSDIFKFQGLWVQDFPLPTQNNKVPGRNVNLETSLSEDFKETLQDYLKRLGIDKSWIDLSKYDFSRVKVVLISSVPGYNDLMCVCVCVCVCVHCFETFTQIFSIQIS
jgi:hypothetical protein